MPVDSPLFPVGLIVARRRALVVGQGRVAFDKATQLQSCGADVDIVHPDDYDRTTIGGYRFDNVHVQMNLGQRRTLSGQFALDRGTFYDGTKTSLSVSRGRLSAGSQLSLEPTYTRIGCWGVPPSSRRSCARVGPPATNARPCLPKDDHRARHGSAVYRAACCQRPSFARNAASSRHSTPSCSALSCLEPASWPTTTNEVFCKRPPSIAYMIWTFFGSPVPTLSR